MSGKVIQALRAGMLATSLTEAELRALANCGRIQEYAAGDQIVQADGMDERLFVLREGQVALKVTMWSESGQCGGEAEFQVTSPGEPFGWAAWIQADRIAITAQAVASTALVALDLERLDDSQTFLKVTQRMLQSLYGRLQEGGLCPPNIRGLLRLRHVLGV